MKPPTVYEILQTQKGNHQAARLIHALDELSGRLENASGSDVVPQLSAGLQHADELKPAAKGPLSRAREPGRSGSYPDFSSLQLPDPAAGPLPLFPGASEFDALQLAATHTSRQLRSNAERHAWRSWVMAPHHIVLVVEAAWLLLALVFRQEDVCAAALQEHVFNLLAQHYVSEVLAGQAAVQNAAGLWAEAIADAGCRLLRAAFPSVSELRDPQLQLVLHRQLRLWTTGLLPGDVTAPCLLAAQHQGSSGEEAGDDGALSAMLSSSKASKANAAGRCAAAFVSVKPGPLVSSFMAQKGLKPADLLRTHGPRLKSLTVSREQQQQQQQQSCQEQLGTVDNPTPQQLQQLDPSNDRISKQRTATASAAGVSSANMAGSTALQPAAGGVTGAGGCRAQAAACMAAAAGAAEHYERSKKAGAATVSRGSKAVHQQLQQLQQLRGHMLGATHSKVQAASNKISGWLVEPSGSAVSASSAATDAQCKAQRQLMEGHLRAGDWRMAHTFNGAVHDRCFDMAAAAAAALPAAAVQLPAGPAPGAGAGSSSGSSSGGSNLVGGRWAAIAGSSLVSNRMDRARGGSSASGSQIKITKAARAIVEDVQRKFAATPLASSPPRRR